MPAATVKAFAKINLSLEVLNKRPDGFHNLRSIFQTITLADTIAIEVEPARRTEITLDANTEIPGENLIVRAARAVLEASRVRARVHFRLQKRIPMGGGLGGGSTDAAAVLLALPALLGRPVAFERLVELGSGLGSDVPFFLIGGTALGLGRGTELYPLAEAPSLPALLVAPPVHVSTPDAYRALQRSTDTPLSDRMSVTERLAHSIATGAANLEGENDFEQPVFSLHPSIAAVKRKIARSGAQASMMTGSGSAVFGLYGSKAQRDAAAIKFKGDRVYRISLLSRARYQAAWRRFLCAEKSSNWPPTAA